MTQSPLLTTLKKKPFENIVGRGEDAGDQHFLLFPQCFQPYQRQKSSKYLYFVVCKCFFLKLNFTKRLNFRLVQTESICRPRNKCNFTTEILVGMDRKHCRKGRKCWLPAFSPFPTMISKAFFSRFAKTRDCVVKS